jgi:hypothetical protein
MPRHGAGRERRHGFHKRHGVDQHAAQAASGSGTFSHKSTTGAALASGTWRATELLNFIDYGAGGDGFSAFHAGNALIRVDLLVGGTRTGSSGTQR